MTTDYKKATTEDLNRIEQSVNGAIKFSRVDGIVKEIHIRASDGNFFTITRETYGEMQVLLPNYPKKYILNYNIELADDTKEIIQKEFATEDERSRYMNDKLTYEQIEKAILQEVEVK